MARVAGAGKAAGNQPAPLYMLLLFSAIALLVFVIGPFGYQALDPRALLPLYAALPVLAGIVIARWNESRGPARHLALVFLAALLVLHLTGYRRADRAVVQPSTGELRVPPSLEMMQMILDANGVTRVFTNYYIGYRLAFESGERIIACTDGDPAPERYQPFADEVRTTDRPIAFIAAPRSAALVRGALKERGISWKDTTVNGFHIVQPSSNAWRDWPPTIALCAPAAIEVGDYPKKCRAGTSFTVPVTVTNRSAIPWLAVTSDTCVVQLSYHVVDPETGRVIRQDHPRFSPGAELARGQTATVQMIVEAPDRPGHYAFVPNLIVEYLGWLSTLQPELTGKANWKGFEAEK